MFTTMRMGRMPVIAKLGTILQRTTLPVIRSRPSSTQAEAKPVSPTRSFYKTFTRPVAKVLLMATFTYQLAYWAWVKLEKDEIKRDRTAEIEGLEKQLGELTKGKTAAKP